MAAVAPAPPTALDVTMTAPAPATNAAATQSSPQLVVRLPTDPDSGAQRNTIKRKWRSLVNFFALPIRAYYLEPPGSAYRAQLRARRGQLWDEGDDGMLHSFWPVPAYTDEVGDDEMILFKAQEEAEAIVAAHAEALRRQREAADQPIQAPTLSQDQGSPQFSDTSSDDDDEPEEHLTSPPSLPLALPGVSTMASFTSATAQASPRYEIHDPPFSAGSTLPSSSSVPARPARNPNRRTRTTSNLALAPLATPSFTNGTPMSRHLSTPLTAPSSPSPSPGVFSRRSRANTSLGGRTISEPLSWTLVRSQYSYPKRGLTPQQLSFLSSVESLGRFGVSQSPSGPGAGAEMMPSPAYQEREGADYGFPTVG